MGFRVLNPLANRLSPAEVSTTRMSRTVSFVTCETRVIEGVPDHRDVVLSPEEKASNNVMMICCSGCIGDRLVLDR